MPHPAIPADREEYRAFYERHRDVVFRMLVRLVRDAHHAEDLCQETFIHVWRKRDQYRGDGSVEGWVRRIALRSYYNARPRLAKADVAQLASDPQGAEPDPLDGAIRRLDGGDELAAVRAAVDALPDGWREPFVLYRYEGMSCPEVAEALALTRKAVELRLGRALKAVASAIRRARQTRASARGA